MTRKIVAAAAEAVKLPYSELANADTDREAWLEARRSILTASDVAAVLGITTGAPRIWYEKKGLLAARDLSDNEAVQMGHELEAKVADLYAAKTGRRIERQQSLFRSTAYPWLGATLDYKAWLPDRDDPGPLECKTTGNKTNWPEDGEPSRAYHVQLQTQMLVTNANWGSLSALIGAPFMHHRWIDSLRDDNLCDRILDRTKRFMRSVQSDSQPPELDDSSDTEQALRRTVLGVLAGETVVLPDAAVEWVEKLNAETQMMQESTREIRRLKNRIMAAIGTAEVGEMHDGSGAFTFKVQMRKAYSVKESESRVLHWKGYGRDDDPKESDF